MQRVTQFLFAIILASAGLTAALGQIRIDGSDPSLGIPQDPIFFDCGRDLDGNAQIVSALERHFFVPKNFRYGTSEPLSDWLVWTIKILGDDETVYDFPFARIDIGTDTSGAIDTELPEFQIVSEPWQNHLGARILVLEPREESLSRTYWLLVLKGNHFVKVISHAPVNWVSLLTCFP